MNKQRTKIDELLVDMPIYVRDYTRSKLVIPYSYVTLINYLRIFKRFLLGSWTIITRRSLILKK